MTLHITVELFYFCSFEPYPRGIISNLFDVKKIIHNGALFPKFRGNKVVLTVHKGGHVNHLTQPKKEEEDNSGDIQYDLESSQKMEMQLLSYQLKVRK